MIRIFTAFPVINEIADSLHDLSEKNSAIKNIRWTPKENLHITLFFIGEIEEKKLENVQKVLKNIFTEQNAFTLEFESLILKGKNYPTMLWAGFRKNESFKLLSDKIYSVLKEFMTIPPVYLDPIPHCTLARFKARTDFTNLNTAINLQQRSLKINYAELWKTIQTKNGVRYESLQKNLMND